MDELGYFARLRPTKSLVVVVNMRWTVGRILYATMLLAFVFGIITFFNDSEDHVLIALNSALLALSSIGAYYSRNWRRYFLGYAVFSWIFFIFTVQATFDVILLGWTMGLVCALATKLIPE